MHIDDRGSYVHKELSCQSLTRQVAFYIFVLSVSAVVQSEGVNGVRSHLSLSLILVRPIFYPDHLKFHLINLKIQLLHTPRISINISMIIQQIQTLWFVQTR